MQLRNVDIKNEPKIITSPPTNESNVPWRFLISKIPVVNADAPKAASTAQQAPMVRFNDLPLYSPMLVLCAKDKTKEYEKKLLHKKVYPYITKYRKHTLDTMKLFMTPIMVEVFKIGYDVRNKKNKFIEYMRDPDNLQMRRAIFASGTVGGFTLVSRTRYITRRIFWGSIGALYSGWLCFPKETDVAVRKISHTLGTTMVTLASKFCGMNLSLDRGRLPCFKDICIPEENYALVMKECNDKKLKK